MTGKNKHIRFTLWSLPVLVLYSLFFTVQVFFNFDNGNANAQSNQRHVIVAQQNGQHTQSVSGHSKHENQLHSKIRLNKRFQPSSSPELNPFYVTAPLIFVEPPVKPAYSTPFHTPPSLFTRPLRGPPVVVCHFV